MSMEILMLWPLKTNLVGKFPCLLTLLHTNLECYLFCKSLHILCVRDQFVKGRISLLKQCVIFFKNLYPCKKQKENIITDPSRINKIFGNKMIYELFFKIIN